MASTFILPAFSVQPSFPDVIDDVQKGRVPEDTFWMSYFPESEPNVHAKVRTTLDEVDRDLVRFKVEDSDFEFGSSAGRSTVFNPATGHKTKIFTPDRAYVDPSHANMQEPLKIMSFGVAPDGSQFATGLLDGAIHLYTTKHQNPIRPYASTKAHKSTPTSLAFFPSSKVLLSSSADFSLSIFAADLPSDPSASVVQVLSPVRNLAGHKGSVTTTAMIGRGRQILSGSSDATIRLWDVSIGETISTITAQSGISRIALVPQSNEGNEAQPQIVLSALTDGHIQIFDLRLPTHSSVAASSVGVASSASSSLTTIAISSDSQTVAAGSSKGRISLFDVRSFSTPHEIATVRRAETSVEDLLFLPSSENKLAVATSDGLAWVAGLSNITSDGNGDTRELEVQVDAEIVGGDCDAVRVLRTRPGELWTASDDGIVRQYNIW